MKAHIAFWATLLALVTQVTSAYATQDITAARFGQNPLILLYLRSAARCSCFIRHVASRALPQPQSPFGERGEA